MSSSPRLPWIDRFNFHLDRRDPYLGIHCVNVFVRDIDRSLRFYVDQLGFALAYDAYLPSGDRWAAVAPPDGAAVLTLIGRTPDSEEYIFVGRPRLVAFATDDVLAKFHEWSERGVRFDHPPEVQSWGGMFTRFEDLDGNSFALVSHDAVSEALEAQRRAIAEKLESERRIAQELEIARQVQARLFPQVQPPLQTLDYAGICVQARQVGGDYYDFLDLGRDRLGLVIGDISGKGIAGALLMANLQANLRSQSAIALDQPQRLLRVVNQVFCENSSDNAYATLFFAEYDDRSRRLRYANCGHLAPLLLRSDGALERLDSTCTVLGLFRNWNCSISERQMLPGDTLVLYTDGVTESFNEAEDEFGEQRLIETLQRHRQEAPKALLRSIIDEVQQFSAPEQHDDITLVVAKCR